jgi:hypothetical protein
MGVPAKIVAGFKKSDVCMAAQSVGRAQACNARANDGNFHGWSPKDRAVQRAWMEEVVFKVEIDKLNLAVILRLFGNLSTQQVLIPCQTRVIGREGQQRRQGAAPSRHHPARPETHQGRSDAGAAVSGSKRSRLT